MQSPNKLPPDEPSISEVQKRKTIISKNNLNLNGFQSSKSGSKVSKTMSTNRALDISQKPESLSSDSLENEYGALRRKYRLLEEESFGVGKELSVVEDEVKALEKEKLALLDDLVVLEGLIDPSELQSRR